ncbi:saccharopine dehydrogenase NADP-binding domain-containing protein [Solirubrobacter sp. CPCC 204708]|uniref:Saccharopine dehydrogenase NADP-binding domain-containing protein n=1 Tax=Solirubrobacter deserti TaxID=2282478 RepID=A0ABT4RGM3_9ACTN|nr:saccharopine dehydrogenase NADP-binding domain-containing protein [Solirubrobacter deserti]MBE2319623.1 saccharopine dehydrogenase NADP-binding domain-containing protein [Solirubrobacter deserti]MDA0137638.1 saccharopine dehydrogenase NADP-binding domain-containing protein [Solirubrobacter deserti]
MYDIVVFGATGFVGRLIAEYLDSTDADVALAGRSREKLEALGIDRPLIVADADDPAALARSARVVATTVGPYRKGGLKLVDACVEAGTAYCDLTGEILFAHEAIARHEAARASGARIVLSCGFDSIPSDLGTFLLHQAAGELGETTLVVKALRGGASGGTLASMKGQVDEMRGDRAARKVVLTPNSLGGTDRSRDVRSVMRDPEHGWVGPFVMASYNTRIVRRSSELLGYGPAFTYREVSAYGNPLVAAGFTAGLGALAGGLAFPPTRFLLDRVLPGPGDGPSEKARANGHFKVEVHGAGHVATVAAKGDPGYAATAVMMGESALTLARTEGEGGVLTPAAAMSDALVERLRRAGMTLAVKSFT